MQDVADAAHLSLATASKALNGTGHIAAHTRRLVQTTAQELGYQQRTAAEKRIVRQQSGLIGLVSADLEGRFSMPALAGAEDTLGVANHAVLLTNSRGDPQIERNHIDQMAARGVDGLLILGGETDARPPVKPSTVLGIPIVYVYAPSTDPADSSITVDNGLAGQAAINHLLGQGRTHIAILAGPEYYAATKDRVKGAEQAMAEAGLRFSAPTRYGNWHESWGRVATNLLIESGEQVDGLYCLNDMLARGAIESFLEHGIRVPEDVAVIGHDNWSVTATECRIPITTFDNNMREMGRKAARMLLSAIKGRPQRGMTLMDCSLIIRESTVSKR
nr:LacI family DNA-binding transcriptional regulator [Bifidobacterium colobi]